MLPASNGSKKVSNSNSTSSLDRISGSKALNKLKYSMLSNTDERIYYNAIKVLWYAGEKSRALSELSSFVEGFSHNQLDANAKKRLSGRFGSSDTLDNLSKIVEIASSSENALASPSEVAGISDSLSAEKHHVDFRVNAS